MWKPGFRRRGSGFGTPEQAKGQDVPNGTGESVLQGMVLSASSLAR
jgi:hypothetical protein